jgi:hypothetical protein
MAADHRPLDTDEFISQIEEMRSRVPKEEARGERAKRAQLRTVYPIALIRLPPASSHSER